MPPVTRFTTLGVGSGAFGVGVLATAAVGSLLLGGDVVTDSSKNTAPSLVYDSGSYLTYQETAFVESGTYALRAEISIPSTYSSGALVHMHSSQCRSVPTQGFDVVITRNVSAAGTGSSVQTVRNNVTLVSDQANTHSTGAFVMPIGSKLGIYAGTGAASATTTDCKLKLWTSEIY